MDEGWQATVDEFNRNMAIVRLGLTLYSNDDFLTPMLYPEYLAIGNKSIS